MMTGWRGDNVLALLSSDGIMLHRGVTRDINKGLVFQGVPEGDGE